MCFRYVVGPAVWIEPRQKPHTQLRMREGYWCLILARAYRGIRGLAGPAIGSPIDCAYPGTHGLDCTRHARDSGRLPEQRMDPHIHAEDRLYMRHAVRVGQRIATAEDTRDV